MGNQQNNCLRKNKPNLQQLQQQKKCLTYQRQLNHQEGRLKKVYKIKLNKLRLMSQFNQKQELEQAYEKIREFESIESNKQIQSLRSRVKELDQSNRTLKIQSEKVKYSVDSNQEEKMKDLTQKINFFQSQKQYTEKQKKDLKSKIQRLEAQLQQQEEKDDILEKMTFKIQNLEMKNEKMKGQLEAANTEIKNATALGGISQKSTANLSQVTQEIKTLNQMVSLLESDLNQQKQKNEELAKELENNSGKANQITKLQRKIKSKEQQIQILKNEVQSYSDAASFVEKLTLDMINKEQLLTQNTKKLKQYIDLVEKLENEEAQNKQMVDLQTQQLQNQEDQIQKMLNERTEFHNQITLIKNQNAKYLQKIRELTEKQSVLANSISGESKIDESSEFIFNTDMYQHKYYDICKIHNEQSKRFLNYQLQSSNIRNTIGVYMTNIVETLPEQFTQRFYPQVIQIVVKIKNASDKLYLLFDTVCSILKEKADLYSRENQSIAQWMIMILDQIPILYHLLYKIELGLITCQTQEQIRSIISHSDLKSEINRIDVFASQLLNQIITENIDVEINFDPFIEPIDNLDKICLQVKRLPMQSATKLQLCSQTMKIIHQINSSIQLYKSNSEVHQNAQVDTMIQNFLKMVINYLRQCCINPHIRYKSEMKKYLEGISLINNIFKQIELNDNIQELSSLYSDIEDIKLLKDTILTTQYHVKQLAQDLNDISYPTPLHRIQVRLTGRVWQDKIKQIKGSLNRFNEIVTEKAELQSSMSEQKKKIIILEKQIKDRQVTKELHEKRIGQLQLKVEQSIFLENQFKRQTEKVKNMDQANKLIEDELSAQNKKKKDVEEQLRKVKQKFDIFQTEAMMKRRNNKNQNISSQDVSSLGIFKQMMNQCTSLRNSDTKKKVHQIKNSPILCFKDQKSLKQKPQKSTLRRKLMSELCNLKIEVQGKINLSNLDKVYEQISLSDFKKQSKKSNRKDYDVGSLILRNPESETMLIDQNIGRVISI